MAGPLQQLLDQRRVRRVLTEEESRRLIAVAREQARVVPGAETRPLWYLLPLLAGLRRGDMVRMRWVDLDLSSTPPTLTIKGGKARRRVDVIPVHPEVVRELNAIKPANVHPTARVFPSAPTHLTRRKDFQRAGIVLETADGHADLHALRHTFGTRLAEADASVAKLQRLMRHGSVQLTLDYYVKLDPEALDQTLGLLPGIGGESARADASAS